MLVAQTRPWLSINSELCSDPSFETFETHSEQVLSNLHTILCLILLSTIPMLLATVGNGTFQIHPKVMGLNGIGTFVHQNGYVKLLLNVLSQLPFVPTCILLTSSRYSEVLTHDLRSSILDIVHRSPGIHLSKVVRETNSHESTIRYHTRVLETSNHIQTAPILGYLRMYPITIQPNEFELYAALQDESTLNVLFTVAMYEPLSVTKLANELDKASSTISHHVSRLEEADLLSRKRVGQSVEISLDTNVRDIIHSKNEIYK